MFNNFSEFIQENNQLEVTFTFERDSTYNINSIVEELNRIAKEYQLSLNEDIGKTGDANVGYGVKGKLKAKGELDDDTVINPNVEITKQDVQSLQGILSKITRGIQLFGELEEYLKQYNKINFKPISQIVDQLNSFSEAVSQELANFKQ